MTTPCAYAQENSVGPLQEKKIVPYAFANLNHAPSIALGGEVKYPLASKISLGMQVGFTALPEVSERSAPTYPMPFQSALFAEWSGTSEKVGLFLRYGYHLLPSNGLGYQALGIRIKNLALLGLQAYGKESISLFFSVNLQKISKSVTKTIQ